MKTLLYVAITILLFAPSFGWGEHKGHAHDDATLTATKQVDGVENNACADIIDVTVNGLVCDFCARALEKVIGKRDDVLGIDVDLDNANVSIAMKAGETIDDTTLTKLVTDAGYNVVTINRGC